MVTEMDGKTLYSILSHIKEMIDLGVKRKFYLVVIKLNLWFHYKMLVAQTHTYVHTAHNELSAHTHIYIAVMHVSSTHLTSKTL